MTIAVDLGRKATKQTKNQSGSKWQLKTVSNNFYQLSLLVLKLSIAAYPPFGSDGISVRTFLKSKF